jgi:hypothetical protein
LIMLRKVLPLKVFLPFILLLWCYCCYIVVVELFLI